MYGTSFEIFGYVHLITMLVILLVSIFFPKIYKNKTERQKQLMSRIVAAIIAAHVIISPYKDLYLIENPYNWVEVLPFHMCDLSEIFLIIFLLGGPSILYKCAFFWGLGGATMAIITPDILFHDLDYIFFMIGHGMIIVGIMYATVSLGNRPYSRDIVSVCLITIFLLLPIVYIINIILGEPANYWYLVAKPDGASLMDMFPDPPYHLLYTTPIALALFYIIYLPYFIKDNYSKQQ